MTKFRGIQSLRILVKVFYMFSVCFGSTVNVRQQSILSEWKRLFPAEPQNPALPEVKHSAVLLNYLSTMQALNSGLEKLFH